MTNGIDGKTGEATENASLSINAANGIDIVKHQTYESILASGSVNISNNQNGALNVYGSVINKKGDTQLYGSNGVSVFGTVENDDGNVTMTAQRSDLLLAKGSLTHLATGNIELYQNDPVGLIRIDGQLIAEQGTISTFSFSEETNGGSIFAGIFNDENDIEDYSSAYQTEPQYVVSENMEFGYDVSQDKGLLSSVKILRMNRRGATVVNNKDWKVGDNVEVTLNFDNVDVTVKCQVIKVEDGLAQVRFKDLPKDIANKITYRYMRASN